MPKKYAFFLLFLFPCVLTVYSQNKTGAGNNRFDVLFYDLYVSVFPETQSITGNNRMKAIAISATDTAMIHLDAVLRCDSILFRGKSVPFFRQRDSLFVVPGQKIISSDTFSLLIYYHGKPKIAPKPPWEGGFVWKMTPEGKYWLGVACQETGARCWWPCKDVPNDEPDSVHIQVEAPFGYSVVSNGQNKGSRFIGPSRKIHSFRVTYPINLYNITLNMAPYVHWEEKIHLKNNDSLLLGYYFLRSYAKKAHHHFHRVKKMLSVYEDLFGPYPFVRNGYNLVQTAYWGMEHQSCIAYGSDFRDNAFGFDFILIHESAHEYFGNSISSADPAWLWIHEAFATYAEVLYVERTKGYARSLAYLQTLKENILNRHPIEGMMGSGQSYYPDADMYYKGAWMLHSLRNKVANDTIWFSILKEMNRRFRYKTISASDLVGFLEEKTGLSLSCFFDEFLKQTEIPMLEYSIDYQQRKYILQYRWKTTSTDFCMPVDLRVKGRLHRLYPGKEFKQTELDALPVWDMDAFYFITKKSTAVK